MYKLLEQVAQKNAENTARIAEQTMGYVVSDNTTGNVAATSLDNTTAVAIAKHMHTKLVNAAQSAVRDIDPSNQLCFMRVKTRKFEYLVAPEELYTISVLQ